MKATSLQRKQSGMMLLEALIAILIFAVGILGIVGLQATSIKQGTDARYRSEAAMLANQYIGQMWLTDGKSATLAAQFSDSSGAGSAYAAWVNTVRAVLPVPSLPTDMPPSVNVNSLAGSAGEGTVTITIYWHAPGDPYTGNAGDPNTHSYVAIAQIKPAF